MRDHQVLFNLTMMAPKKLLQYFDLKTLTVSLVTSFIWILFSDYLVHQGFYHYFDVQTVQTVKGLFYVTCLSFLLAYFHQREKNVLRRQQEDYTRLFSDSPQILWIYRLSDYQILDVNQRAVDHYGYSKKEFLSMTILELRPEREKAKLRSVLSAGHLRLNNSNTGWVHQKKDGEEFPVEVYGREIYFQSQLCRLVTISDVTELRSAEELSLINSKLITLGEVSANIGHEIKNPLSIMELTLSKLEDQLKSDGSYERNKKDLELLNSSILRVSDTVSSLQRLSRGEVETDRDEVLVSLLVKESTILMRQQFEMHGVSLEFGYLPDVKMYCHSGQITQVLLNLFKNALDALVESDSSHRFVRVEAKVDEKQERIQIIVQNNGPLLDEAILDDLFTPFFTTKEKGQGSGLGLPLSKKIVDAHDGELSYQVIDNRVHFIVDLPLRKKA